MSLLSFPSRLESLAAVDPDRPAVSCAGSTMTRRELQSASTRLARELEGLGVKQGDFVTVAVPNSVDWFVAYVACWMLGAVPQPTSAKLPARELAAIVELAGSKVVVGAPDAVLDLLPAGTKTLPIGHQPNPALSDELLPDRTSPAWKAPTSGGSTGRPKLIVSGDPAVYDTDAALPLQLQPDGALLMPGPLYHNGPGVWACQALLAGNHVVLLVRFDAEASLAAIEEHRCDVAYMVPTMMKRISRLDDDVRLGFDLSSLRIVWHLAEPCPQWLKAEWIDWLGPERILELYAGTEAQAVTVITGAEWLEHRGSVGRVTTGEMKVCDEHGVELAVGEQGEVWMRSTRDTPTYQYVGADAKTLDGGWESLGDIGWFDADGYLYLGDRVADMILCGGANIYPAEVENALNEHPLVHSCAVIGMPHDDRGNDVHAIVQADGDATTTAELLEFLAERLAAYKLPRTVEYVDTALRDDAGKVRRSALRAERISSSAASTATRTANGRETSSMNEHVDNSEPTSRSAFRLLAKRLDATNRDADNLRKALLAQWNERSGTHRLELKLQKIDATDSDARLAAWFTLADPGNGQLVAAGDHVLAGVSDELRDRLAATARPVEELAELPTAKPTGKPTGEPVAD